MRWVLSDGTTVEFGGEVVGDSRAAREVREALDQARAGTLVLLRNPIPSGTFAANASNPLHIEQIVFEAAYHGAVRVVERPALEYPPAVEWPTHTPDGCPIVY